MSCWRRARGRLPAAAADAAVKFEWFEYTGQDAIYSAPPAVRRFPQSRFCRATTPIRASRAPATSTIWSIPRSRTGPGIPIHESTDLVHWKLDRPRAQRSRPSSPSTGLNISRGVFAPSIHFHKGTFYIVNTLVEAGGNFFVTANEPGGPVVRARLAPGNRRHRSLVLLRRRWQGLHPQQRAARGRAAVRRPSRDLDPGVRPRRRTSSSGPRKVIVNGGADICEEADLDRRPASLPHQGLVLPHVRGRRHRARPLRSRSSARKSPWGPFEPYEGQPHPHAARSARGSRESGDQRRPRGSRADEGWQLVGGVPRVAALRRRPLQHRPRDVSVAGHLEKRLAGDTRSAARPMPHDAQGPGGVRWRAPRAAGRARRQFTKRDEFDGSAGPEWMQVHVPEADAGSNSAAARCACAPLAVNLDEKRNASFLARRQQHLKFEASTRARTAPDRRESRRASPPTRTRATGISSARAASAPGCSVFLERSAGKGAQIVTGTTHPRAEHAASCA